ncbi:MAG: metalloregulator ArsR/SmtB family transcription factor [Pseudomonadota bacterium]
MASIGIEEAAQGFAAVGSEPRLEVLLALVRAGHDGLTVGDIQSRLAIPASTLAHHLRFLAAAGVVTQEKQGRAIINRAAYDRLQILADFLLSECCQDALRPANDKVAGKAS